MKSTKIIALLLVVVMCVSMMVSCKKPGAQQQQQAKDPMDYTYYTWSTALGTNWNPHTWETNADNGILSYLETPLANMAPLNTTDGTYQWIFEAAESITDVTADHQDDLTKYHVTLPDGVVNPSDVTDSYVYEIKLNKNMRWQNGDQIDADTYIYSMQMLLNSKMRNYRANNYIDGNSALAGALAYYNSEAPIYAPVVPAYGEGETPDYSLDLSKYHVYLDLSTTGMTIAGYSFKEFVEDYGFIYDDYQVEVDENGEPVLGEDDKPIYVLDDEGNKIKTVFGYTYYEDLLAEVNAYGYVEVTEANMDKVLYLMDMYCAPFGLSIYTEDAEGNPIVWDELYREFLFYFTETYGDKVEYDGNVGLYKVDQWTIRYVCQFAYEYNYFLTSCTSNWLVHKETYEKTMREEGGLTVTSYNTSLDTTMSYGAYKLSTFEDDKQVVFVQNEQWYGFKKNGDKLVSYTDFEVDGKTHEQYQTTKIVINVMTQENAYQEFQKGALTDYAPTAQELLDYVTSDRLYKVDETYTMRFFFNTNVQKLQALDEGANNENAVVISNENFRKAMSLAIDRAEYVTATEGWKPAYSLMNGLYHYDIYNDPTSSYRASEPAMKAIVDLYGVKYGAGEIYPTLEKAYQSITGYNLTEAQNLMKLACEELVEAGLYTAGQDIKIQIGWAKGALTDSDNAQLALLNKFVNEALKDSGFGKITFEAIDKITDRYKAVPAGDFAIGYGAWGGAAFYPFTMFRVYMDPSYTSIHEAGCWKPAEEELTLTFTIDGEEVTDTMTWQKWSTCLEGTGKYANLDNADKLVILAQLEREYLELYYCIPIAGTTICTLLSYQVDEYTENYNIMYGFGGFRLMSWNFTDMEWAAYVQSQGGTLSYK